MKKLYIFLAGGIAFIGLTAYAATPILFPVNGGTGTSTKPTAGQILTGQSDQTYAPQSPSTLAGSLFSTTSANYWNSTLTPAGGFSTTSADYYLQHATVPVNTSGTGTSTFAGGVDTTGIISSNTYVSAPNFRATSTTATSTFSGAVQLGATAGSNFLRVTAAKNYPASDSTGGMVQLTNTQNSGSALDIFSNFGAGATNDMVRLYDNNAAYDRRVISGKTDSATSGVALFDCTSVLLNAACYDITSESQLHTALGVTGAANSHSILKVVGNDSDAVAGNGSNANAAVGGFFGHDANILLYLSGTDSITGTGSTTGPFVETRNFDGTIINWWDHFGRLGHGTASPAAGLELATTSVANSGSFPYFDISSSTSGDIMTVVPSGNVGIGTTTPSARLSVDSGNSVLGNNALAGSFTATSTTATSTVAYGMSLLESGGTLNLNNPTSAYGKLNIRAQSGVAILTSATKDIDTPSGETLRLYSGGVFGGVFDNSGFLGLGASTTPNYQLSVGTDRTSFYVNRGVATTTVLGIQARTSSDQSGYRFYQDDSQILRLQREDQTPGADKGFTLFGLEAPYGDPREATFSVKNSTTSGATTLGQFMEFYDNAYGNGDAHGTNQFGIRIQNRNWDFKPFVFDFYNGTTFTEAFRIATTAPGTALGYVGFGTTTPWAKLSVEGNTSLGNSATAGFFVGTSSATSIFTGSVKSLSFLSPLGNLLLIGNGTNTAIRPDSSGGDTQIQSFAGGVNTTFPDAGGFLTNASSTVNGNFYSTATSSAYTFNVPATSTAPIMTVGTAGAGIGIIGNPGDSNFYFGSGALVDPTGSRNLALGTLALHAITSANDDTAAGRNACTTVTSGSRDSCFGSGAGSGTTSGADDLFLGTNAGSSSGASGISISTGNRNIIIGNNSGSTVSAVSDSATFGYGAIVGESNAFVFGNGNDTTFGFGSTTPSRKAVFVFQATTTTSVASTTMAIWSSGTTTVQYDSTSVTQGYCGVFKDSDGVGYTYVTYNNGVQTISTTPCRNPQ